MVHDDAGVDDRSVRMLVDLVSRSKVHAVRNPSVATTYRVSASLSDASESLRNTRPWRTTRPLAAA